MPPSSTAAAARPRAAAAVLDRAAKLHAGAHRTALSQQYAEASRLLRRALKLLDRVPAADQEQQRLRVRVLSSLAHTDAEAYGLREGMPSLQQAGRLVSSMPAGTQRMTLEGLIERQRGNLLWRAGRLPEALVVLDKAVVATDKALASGAPVENGLISALTARALVNSAMGNPLSAGVDLRRCLWLGHTYHSPLTLAITTNNLGEMHYRMGDAPTALRYYEEAERLMSRVAPTAVPKVRSDRAQVLLYAGLAEEAANALDESFGSLREQGGNRDLAEAETLRAAAAVMEGDFATARSFAQLARRRYLRQERPAMAWLASLTGLHAAAGAAMRAPRKPSKALVRQALELSEGLSGVAQTDESAVAKLLAVRLQLRRGEVSDAARLLSEVPAPRRFTSIDHRMLRRLARAEVAVATGDRRTAFSQARAGFTELGRTRDRMGGLELVSGTAVHGRELGVLAVRLVLDGNRSTADARRLFDWLERTRAQVYRYEPQPSIDDPELADRITEIRGLTRAMQLAKAEGRRVREMAARHAALQQEVTRLGWQTTVWGRPRPVADLAEVGKRLEDRAMISFAAVDDTLVAVVIVDGRPRLVRLGSVADARQAAKMLHADLDALAPDHLPSALVEVVSASARRRAQFLDDQLLRPLSSIIGDRELVVVPTGPLYPIAWGALPSLRGRPVVVAPSATAWLAASADQQLPGTGRSVLVGGPDLPAAVGEVAQLTRYLPGAQVLEGPRATVETVLEALDGAQLAHIAAHGMHEPGNALFSRLDLVDGGLFAHETARLQRPPEQVVLAACELAMTRIRPGDEALGFAGALLATGVRTVTAAVSRVGDQTAAESMAFYHRRVAEGARPAVALADATAVDPLRRPFICLGASN
ncbi:CHAT domain-containing protein [Kutzneria chonburiensis]|uniref:CHAT domain-containing protein n=1 Tax=Kutzneria chonburiensis TaxID=1483604 RepID=A0ABV6N4B5_9PSEU|nr:CHAT domain-containing protein [Kutzneria chonburiensis]